MEPDFMLASVDHLWLFFILLPLIAFLYAAVGHGGASGYLALMSLFSFPALVMKPTALLLNLFVAGIAFVHFYRKKHFNRHLFFPFALASVPAAFLGGYLTPDTTLYKKILAVLLIFAILRMLGIFGEGKLKYQRPKLWQGLLAGSLIGFFSGMIGIGGGIILSPLILLMGWGNIKEAAAVSALFIWVNSAAAMAGFALTDISIEPEAFLMVGVAVIGGFLGGYFGSSRFNNKNLRKVLAFVLILASVKLLLT